MVTNISTAIKDFVTALEHIQQELPVDLKQKTSESSTEFQKRLWQLMQELEDVRSLDFKAFRIAKDLHGMVKQTFNEILQTAAIQGQHA